MVGTETSALKVNKQQETRTNRGPQLVVDNKPANLITDYIAYTNENECPTIYHRWSCISGIGALLGRNIFVQHGHFRIFPNLYTMFIGSPGSRKSTAIKLLKKVMIESGFNSFSAEKTSKEKFLLDLEGLVVDGEDALNKPTAGKSSITEQNLWGDDVEFTDPKEVFICADEFNEFAGSGNMEFYTTLGNLWDWDSEQSAYKQRLKNSRSVSIFQPTVSILAGNTPENFARAFPPEVIGQGFLSRLLFIHGDRSGKKFAFPPSPREEETTKIGCAFYEIRNRYNKAEMEINLEAREILSIIYESWLDIPDPRFSHYSSRRYTQLLKLCIITAVATDKKEVDIDTVLLANTQLTAAELLMPKALGEFGKARNSDISHKILTQLQATKRPLPFKDLWATVHNDLDKPIILQDMIQGLVHADKIQFISGMNGGYLAKIKEQKIPDYVDFGLLTEEERMEL